MKSAAKQQAKVQEEPQARPTISLARVITTATDTSTFGGWGPKVSAGNLLKNWN